MSIRQRLTDDMKQAMRSRESLRLTTIRMLRAKLLEREVELRAAKGKDYQLDDDEAQVVIASYAKQRRDSIESYRQAGRDDLADTEQSELTIVADYLPEQLGEGEVRKIVQEAVAESGASSTGDLGTVMRLVLPRVKGRADGKLVNRLVREALSG